MAHVLVVRFVDKNQRLFGHLAAERPQLAVRYDGARGIVGIADIDERRLLRYGAAHSPQVHLVIIPQRDTNDIGANSLTVAVHHLKGRMRRNDLSAAHTISQSRHVEDFGGTGTYEYVFRLQTDLTGDELLEFTCRLPHGIEVRFVKCVSHSAPCHLRRGVRILVVHHANG